MIGHVDPWIMLARFHL